VAIIGTRGYPSYYGGFETAVRRLAPYLVDEGWAVTVYGRPLGIRPDDTERDARVESVITKGIEAKSLSTLSYGLTSALHAARSKPDVALVMNVANGFWLPVLKRAGIPTLVNVDGIEWDREKWGRIAKATFRRGAAMTAKHGTQLVYDSREIARRWARDFGTDGVFIPYGGESPQGELPVEPGLRHRGYVLMVARFVPENSVQEFFDAVPEISSIADVVIVGSSGYGGDLDERAQELSRSNSRVKWLGHVSDDNRLHSLWQHAGVYFHGHTVGGTNPALVQAMACGAPIVAMDTPYNREVLGPGGVYTTRRPSDIAAHIAALLREPASSSVLGNNMRARAAAEYTWEMVNERYARELESLLANQPVEA